MKTARKPCQTPDLRSFPRQERKPALRSGLTWAALTIVALVAVGCQSAGSSGASSFAAVVIPGGSVAQIAQVTATVFQEDGYEGFATGGAKLTLEKRGTAMDAVAYGGWIGDRTARVRVKVEILPSPGGAHRVQCQAYMVRHAGDSFFEEEQRVGKSRRGPYQTLLDQVAARLK